MKKRKSKKHYKVWVEGKIHPLLITANNEAKARYLVKMSYPSYEIKEVVWSPGNEHDFNYLLDN